MLSAISDRTRLLDIFSPDATHEGSFCPSLCRGAGSRPQATPEVSTLTPNTSDPEVMAGTEGGRFFAPPCGEARPRGPPPFAPLLRARGFGRQTPPHSSQADLIPEPGGSRK